jgi:hemolysin activation/secretion protein
MEECMANEQSPAVESLRQEQKTQRKEERELTSDQKLERALKDTFPASDPVAEQVPITPGGAKEEE